jgi:ABC-2 type transport system permease protein
MRNSIAIARREFFAHFGSPAAYVAISLFLALLGVTFFFNIPYIIPKPAFFEAREASLRYLFEWMLFLFTIILPAISMRLLAEERKLGTIEVLLTLPVTESEVVLGKLLGSFGFLLVALSLTLVYPIMLAIIGNPDPGPIVGGYLGVMLVSMAYLAIGLLASSWTSSQIIAFISAIVICAGLTFVDRIPEALGMHAIAALDAISFGHHFNSIARGVLDTRDIVYFAAVLVTAFCWTVYSLETRKWKKGA